VGGVERVGDAAKKEVAEEVGELCVHEGDEEVVGEVAVDRDVAGAGEREGRRGREVKRRGGGDE
jgi:hypothetical protein